MSTTTPLLLLHVSNLQLKANRRESVTTKHKNSTAAMSLFPCGGVIAVTFMWWNKRTKSPLLFDSLEETIYIQVVKVRAANLSSFPY